MSDSEDGVFFLESWTSPEKRKRNKGSKRGGKRKSISTTTPTEENPQKKKKKSKFKDAMEARKEKKKGKKKRKRRAAVELDGSFIFTQANPAASTPRRKEKPKPGPLTRESTTNRKKKVAFDLPPDCIRVKRPKFASPEEKEEAESCSQVTATGPSRSQDNDSQSTSDDVNSQDLFITQKTFRAPPSEPSSGEASNKAVSASPRVLTQRDKTGHGSVVEVQEGSDKRPRGPAQDGGWYEPHPRKETSFQSRMEGNVDLTEEDEVSRPAHTRPSVVDPDLDEPVVVNSSPDVAKTNPRTSIQRSSSTQTENFFTSELSCYLSFCRNSRATVRLEDLKPLDLSLPQRARKDPKTPVIKVKDGVEKRQKTSRLPGGIKGGRSVRPSGSSQGKGGKKDPSGQGQTTTSPQSESEPKSADTTTSGEDNEPLCRGGKVDLTQVRAVQMRLNESFFFKTKGEGQSPRPESPLMKLAQGRGVQSRKCH